MFNNSRQEEETMCLLSEVLLGLADSEQWTVSTTVIYLMRNLSTLTD